MLPSRPAERRLAHFGLPELLQRRRVVRRPPALVRQWPAPTARMEWVVGVHRTLSRMSLGKQAHLAALTATFAPKLRLPVRPARLVAEYWGHVGFY